MDADKKKIWVSGQTIEVTDAVYEAYMKGDRKMRYFENDLKAERILLDEDGQIKQIILSREDSLDRLMDDNAEQFSDRHESVEDMVLRKISVERLHTALSTLSEKERELIETLFFEEKTERDVASAMGISQPAVHKQKNKILKKLKLFLENYAVYRRLRRAGQCARPYLLLHFPVRREKDLLLPHGFSRCHGGKAPSRMGAEGLGESERDARAGKEAG